MLHSTKHIEIYFAILLVLAVTSLDLSHCGQVVPQRLWQVFAPAGSTGPTSLLGTKVWLHPRKLPHPALPRTGLQPCCMQTLLLRHTRWSSLRYGMRQTSSYSPSAGCLQRCSGPCAG